MSINCWFGLKNPVKKFNPFSLYQSQILGKPIKQWFFFVKSSWSNLQPQKKQMFHGFPVISPSFPVAMCFEIPPPRPAFKEGSSSRIRTSRKWTEILVECHAGWWCVLTIMVGGWYNYPLLKCWAMISINQQWEYILVGGFNMI